MTVAIDPYPNRSEFRFSEPTAPQWDGAAVGCTPLQCANLIERYTGVKVANLTALATSMGNRCRAHFGTDHGIPGKSTWGTCCVALELMARGLPFQYKHLTWAQIEAAIAAEFPVVLPVTYGKIRFVAKTSYSKTVPTKGRSDSFTGGHMKTVWKRAAVSTQRISTDADFGSASRPVIPPHGTVYATDLKAGWENIGRWSVCVATKKPPTIVPTPQPPPATHRIHFAANAGVRSYRLQANGCILPGWTDSTWGPKASSAACGAPIHRSTCDGESGATTVLVSNGVYAGQHLRVGVKGVSVSAT